MTGDSTLLDSEEFGYGCDGLRKKWSVKDSGGYVTRSLEYWIDGGEVAIGNCRATGMKEGRAAQSKRIGPRAN